MELTVEAFHTLTLEICCQQRNVTLSVGSHWQLNFNKMSLSYLCAECDSLENLQRDYKILESYIILKKRFIFRHAVVLCFVAILSVVARDLPGGKRILVINMRAQDITFNPVIHLPLFLCLLCLLICIVLWYIHHLILHYPYYLVT